MKNQHSELTAVSGTSPGYVEELILNNIPDAILLVDRSLNLIAFNKKAEKEVYAKLQVKLRRGLSALSLVAENRRAHLMAMAVLVLNGQTRVVEQPRPAFKHHEALYETTVSPARNAAGEIVGILVRSANITERKKAERAIQEAEERWQFAFEASSQAAWEWNMQTNEVIYSSSYKKMYGFLGDELKNDLSEWQNRIHPEDRPKLEQAIQEHSLSDNPYYETTYRIQVKQGDYKWIMARGKVVSRDSDGRPLRMIGTHTDLTQTLRTKEEIRRMNERFHYAAMASSQALWEWDRTTGEAYVSPSFTEMFGWEADENRRFDQWHQYVHPGDRRATIDGYYETLYETKEKIWQATYRLLKADGTYAYVSDKAYILRNEKNEVLKVFGATQDITALKKAEEELHRTRERYALVLKASNEMLWEWDMKGDHIVRSKERLKEVYGWSDDQHIQSIRNWIERVHPDDRERVQTLLNGLRTAEHYQTFEIEYRFLGENGDYAYINNRGVLLKDDEGKPERMIGAAQNITERKRLEAELLQNELEMKKRINQASVDSQEQERSEIGRELHDNINQVLTTTKLYVELAASNKELSEELLAKSVNNINTVIAEIRQLSRSLMDPTIGDLGIVDSLEDLVQNLHLTQKVRILLSVDKSIENLLNRKQKLTIFRIVQEALNNVLRHAKATFAAISIRTYENEVELEVADDGVGFENELVRKGAGLKNITNRVYLINGRLLVESKPGQGCTIIIKFPV